METMRSALFWSILFLTGFTLLAAIPRYLPSAIPVPNVDPLLPLSTLVLLACCVLLIAIVIVYTRHPFYEVWLTAAGGICIAMLGFNPEGTAYARLVILLPMGALPVGIS